MFLMQVVEGTFGKAREEEEVKLPLLQVLSETLVESGMDADTQGSFLLIVNTGEGMRVLTDQDLGEVLIMMELAKPTMMGYFLEGISD
jgi:hypothetical protein